MLLDPRISQCLHGRAQSMSRGPHQRRPSQYRPVRSNRHKEVKCKHGSRHCHGRPQTWRPDKRKVESVNENANTRSTRVGSGSCRKRPMRVVLDQCRPDLADHRPPHPIRPDHTRRASQRRPAITADQISARHIRADPRVAANHISADTSPAD